MFVGVLVGLNEALRPVNYRTESVATGMQSQKSHQRELVDGSDPGYKEIGFRNSRIPPTEVGGLFKSSLFM